MRINSARRSLVQLPVQSNQLTLTPMSPSSQEEDVSSQRGGATGQNKLGNVSEGHLPSGATGKSNERLGCIDRSSTVVSVDKQEVPGPKEEEEEEDEIDRVRRQRKLKLLRKSKSEASALNSSGPQDMEWEETRVGKALKPEVGKAKAEVEASVGRESMNFNAKASESLAMILNESGRVLQLPITMHEESKAPLVQFKNKKKKNKGKGIGKLGQQMSSLVNKWNKVQQAVLENSAAHLAETDANEAQKRKQKEIQQWERDMMLSGAHEDSVNFTPVGPRRSSMVRRN